MQALLLALDGLASSAFLIDGPHIGNDRDNEAKAFADFPGPARLQSWAAARGPQMAQSDPHDRCPATDPFVTHFVKTP